MLTRNVALTHRLRAVKSSVSVLPDMLKVKTLIHVTTRAYKVLVGTETISPVMLRQLLTVSPVMMRGTAARLANTKGVG